MNKILIGDKVKIMTGKDKGKDGVIEKVFVKNGTVLVPGVNMYKKHVKGQQGQKGGIYDIPRPLDVSKIALICPSCKKPTRVGIKNVGKTKERYCKKCNKSIKAKSKQKK